LVDCRIEDMVDYDVRNYNYNLSSLNRSDACTQIFHYCSHNTMQNEIHKKFTLPVPSSCYEVCEGFTKKTEPYRIFENNVDRRISFGWWVDEQFRSSLIYQSEELALMS